MNAQPRSQVNEATSNLRQSVPRTGQMGQYLMQSEVKSFSVNERR